MIQQTIDKMIMAGMNVEMIGTIMMGEQAGGRLVREAEADQGNITEATSTATVTVSFTASTTVSSILTFTSTTQVQVTGSVPPSNSSAPTFSHNSTISIPSSTTTQLVTQTSTVLTTLFTSTILSATATFTAAPSATSTSSSAAQDTAGLSLDNPGVQAGIAVGVISLVFALVGGCCLMSRRARALAPRRKRSRPAAGVGRGPSSPGQDDDLGALENDPLEYAETPAPTLPAALLGPRYIMRGALDASDPAMARLAASSDYDDEGGDGGGGDGLRAWGWGARRQRSAGGDGGDNDNDSSSSSSPSSPSTPRLDSSRLMPPPGRILHRRPGRRDLSWSEDAETNADADDSAQGHHGDDGGHLMLPPGRALRRSSGGRDLSWSDADADGSSSHVHRPDAGDSGEMFITVLSPPPRSARWWDDLQQQQQQQQLSPLPVSGVAKKPPGTPRTPRRLGPGLGPLDGGAGDFVLFRMEDLPGSRRDSSRGASEAAARRSAAGGVGEFPPVIPLETISWIHSELSLSKLFSYSDGDGGVFAYERYP